MNERPETRPDNRSEEFPIAAAGVLLVVMAAALSSPFERHFFAPNFGFFLAEEALMLLPLLLQRPRPAVLGGAMLSVAVGLVASLAWCDWRHQKQGWVLYVSCVPGGAIGGLAAGLAARRWRRRSASFAASAAAAIVAAFLLANASLAA